jgi:hypothetical protein
MALKPTRGILGIEFDEREVRIVELRGKGVDLHVAALTSFAPNLATLASGESWTQRPWGTS